MTYNVQCMCIHAQYIHECLFVCVRAHACVCCVSAILTQSILLPSAASLGSVVWEGWEIWDNGILQ